MGRAFKASNGGLIPHPEGRSAALKIRHRLYINENKCEICKTSHTRYTKSMKCIMCQRYKIELVRYYSRIDPESFVPWPEHVPTAYNCPEQLVEVEEMLAYLRDNEGAKLHYDPCKQHGHIRVMHDGDECVQCTGTLRPREQAIKDGHEFFASSSKCPNCNTFTLRNTVSRQCVKCDYTPHDSLPPSPTEDDNRATPDTIMMRESPDLVMSKEDAISYGFKVYRTGKPCKHGHTAWRYVSTGNCIECLRGEV